MFAFSYVSAFKRTLLQSPSVTAPSAGSLGIVGEGFPLPNDECRIIYTSSVGFASTFPSGQRGRLVQNVELSTPHPPQAVPLPQ